MSTIKSLQLEIPEYMTISQYADMTSYKGQSKFGRLVHTVSSLTGQSKEDVRMWSLDSLAEVSNLYAEVADHKELFHPIIEWNGVLYGYSNIKQFTLGEYIDLETFSKDLENNMHKVAAILYRPVKKHMFDSMAFTFKQGIKIVKNKVESPFDWYELEKYNNKTRKEVEEKFKEFPVHLFLGALSFFLSTGSLYLNHIAYSKKTMSKETKMKMEDLILRTLSQATGVGSEPFTRSLKPMYYQSLETSE
jgi:hypothetical protein